MYQPHGGVDGQQRLADSADLLDGELSSTVQ
jgi:hypothetical protein